VKRTCVRLALLAVVALIAVPALLPATANANIHKLGAGKVVVTLDPFFFVFVSAGYPFYPLAPAQQLFDAPGARLVLPTSGGAWNTTSSRGTFVSKGGIVFLHYTGTVSTLSVPAWHAGINTTAGWTALLNGTRTTILDHNVTGMHTTFPKIHGHTYVKVTGDVLAYNTAFVNAFNTAFGAGLAAEPLGTATLLARLK
jgi:hypothetical protein